jgi:hypothetical protein
VLDSLCVARSEVCVLLDESSGLRNQPSDRKRAKKMRTRHIYHTEEISVVEM